LKINPVSSKTQTKSLGFWRDLSRLCATTSSIIQRTFPPLIFLRQGTTKIQNSFFSTKLFSKVFLLFSCPSQGKITESFLSNLSFRERAFL